MTGCHGGGTCPAGTAFSMPVGTAALALPLPIYNGYSTETEKEYQRARHARFAKEAETRKAAAKAEKSLARRLEERPLVLPNHLCLQKQRVQPHDSHGFAISSNVGGQPLFVGYRDGSRMKNKITSVELCKGDTWYGTYAGPFIKALKTSETRMSIQFRSYIPGHHGKRRITAVKVNERWSFIMDISRPGDNVIVPEAFEWRHKQKYRMGTSELEKEGYVLVQLSTKQAIAHMSAGLQRSGFIFSGDLEIDFLGAGEIYGGLWKLMALVIGIFGTSGKGGFCWSRW